MELDKHKKERVVLIIVALCLLAIAPKVLFRPKKKALLEPANVAAFNTGAERVFIGPPVPAPAVGTGVSLAQATYPDEIVFSKDPFDLPKELHKDFSIETNQDGALIIEQDRPKLDEAMPKFEISGIISGGKTQRVFINDKGYKVGETIEGAQLLEIDKKAALFLYGRKKVWIKLKKQ